tara:strand:- start:1412 stop:2137 length:726 start_codon:yes stop_codon:yes gene_type:complete
MKRFKLARKPILAIALLLTASYAVLKAPEWHAEYIRHKVGSQVVMLTEASGRAGGTGFALQMPSGEVLTMTNAHICELEQLGRIYAHVGRKKIPLEIVEKSINSDLCLLSGIPKLSGLEVADSVAIGQEIGIVGHPALMPLAVNRGNLLGYEKVVVLAGDGPCEVEEGMFKTIMAPWGEVCTEQFEAGLTTVVSLGGNSGSPMIDFYGNVVGVLFAGGGPDSANWGIIVKLSDLKEFIKEY